MKNTFFSLFMLFALLGACKPKEKAQSAQDALLKDSEVFIHFKTTACFGECPVFEMTIYKNLFVDYKGEMFVEPLGNQSGYISQEQLKELNSLIKKSSFFELENEYDGEVTDLPSAYITVNQNGKTKNIHARFNIPIELRKLTKYLSEMPQNVRWDKQAEESQD
jgi:hypothetical protein